MSQARVYKEVKLDGTIADVVAGMTDLGHNNDVIEWGCRAIMDFCTVTGFFCFVVVRRS